MIVSFRRVLNPEVRQSDFAGIAEPCFAELRGHSALVLVEAVSVSEVYPACLVAAVFAVFPAVGGLPEGRKPASIAVRSVAAGSPAIRWPALIAVHSVAVVPQASRYSDPAAAPPVSVVPPEERPGALIAVQTFAAGLPGERGFASAAAGAKMGYTIAHAWERVCSGVALRDIGPPF